MTNKWNCFNFLAWITKEDKEEEEEQIARLTKILIKMKLLTFLQHHQNAEDHFR
jgi:hypothetical protein